MHPPTNCLRCQGPMESGFILELGASSVCQQKWVAGEPVPSFWNGLRIKGVRTLEVITFRCTRCGHLESYAGEAAKT